jgi:hypothetical protein
MGTVVKDRRYVRASAVGLALGAVVAATTSACSDGHDGGGGHAKGGAGGAVDAGRGDEGGSMGGGAGGAGGTCEPPDGGRTCSVPGCGPGITLPSGNDLTGVWIGPAGEVWATGESGFVGRRDPEMAAWCWCAPSPPATLRGAWGASASDLFAVGDQGKLLRFDGARWLLDQETYSDLKAVFGTGSDNVWAVGANGSALRFDGASWNGLDHPDANDQLNAVWIDAAGVVRAGGTSLLTGGTPGSSPTSEAVILRHEPGAATGWMVEAEFPQRGSASFLGMSGSSATDVWAVGTNTPSGAATGIGFIAHFDGTVWASASPPDNIIEGHAVIDVAAATPDDGAAWFLAGNTGIRFDGETWTLAPELANALAIDARDGAMYAVGVDGLVLRWTAAGGWSVDSAPRAAPAIPAP